MKSKKLAFSIFIVLGLSLMLWAVMPFIITSKNLIAKNFDDCSYIKLNVCDSESIGNVKYIQNTNKEDIGKLINAIDDLSYKRISKTEEANKYMLSFTGTYEEKEEVTITKNIFIINFYADNIIGLQKTDGSKSIFYKILDKDFDIKKLIESLPATETF
ncbi:MAG: hypothetical protein RR636_01930 [Clostridium sp.]|uniref:hypothetical protein n=1 Tax=Clostridium sp. TaxID=1506 RepID=UPI003054EB21